MDSIRRFFRQRDDNAVSPVIGTILMVAVTVVLGATVFAAVNSFGNKGLKESSNAVWRAQAIDTDGNGKTDTLKLSYMTGPATVANSEVVISVTSGNTTHAPTSSVKAVSTSWSPGDSQTYKPASAGTYFVSVTFIGTTVVDQSIRLDE